MGKRIVVPSGMEWLRLRLRMIGKTGAGLARHLEIPRERVYEMFKGTRRLQQEEIGPTARYLEWSDAELVAHIEGRGDRPPIGAVQQFEIAHLPQPDIFLSPIVQYRTALGMGGQRGDFMIFAERVDEVPRPFFLKFSAKSFAIRILDDTMHPAYKRWDVVLIDPDAPAIEGENCLFTAALGAEGAPAMLGCLKKSTGTTWVAHQYGAKQDHDLPKAAFPHAWPIVACYHRR